MASINLSGILTNPTLGFDVGGVMLFTQVSSTGTTLASTEVELIIPPDGTYDIDLNYGRIRIDYTTEFTRRFLATVIVDINSTATSIPELLNAAVPVKDDVIIEMEDILGDAVAAKDAAETAALSAVGRVVRSQTLDGAIDAAINNTALIIGDTVNAAGRLAENDGGQGMWRVVDSSSVTANTKNIVIHATLPLALVLIVNVANINPAQWGFVAGALTGNSAVIQACVDYLAPLGGTINIEAGDYPANLLISTPNITIKSNGKVTWRAENTNALIDIEQTGNYTKIIGDFDFRGQTLANESTETTTALHCIRNYGSNTEISGFTAQAARFDNLYIRYGANQVYTDFKLNSTGRNNCSVISGDELTFRRGLMMMNNEFLGTEGANGLYNFDHEPNTGADASQGITLEDILFDNQGTTANNWMVMFHDPFTVDGRSNARLINCDLIATDVGQATVTPASIRLANTGTRTFKGFTIEGCSFEERMFTIAGDEQYLEDAVIDNCDVQNTSLTFGTWMGDNVALSNIRTEEASFFVRVLADSAYTLDNVAFNPDAVARSLNISNSGTEAGNISGVTKFYAKEFSYSDTVNFLDVVEVGVRGTYKLTVGGAEASTGSQGMHISEYYIVSSDNTTDSVSNTILNISGSGLDAQLKLSGGGGGTSVDRRILQVKPQSAQSNQFIVKVEVMGSAAGATVTWLA